MKKLKNRLRQIRHQMQIDKKNEFHELLHLSNYPLYTRWENHKSEPNLESYWHMFKELKKSNPTLHLEDLIEEIDDPN